MWIGKILLLTGLRNTKATEANSPQKWIHDGTPRDKRVARKKRKKIKRVR